MKQGTKFEHVNIDYSAITVRAKVEISFTQFCDISAYGSTEGWK